MKKWMLPTAILLIICAIIAFSTTILYPDLPFQNKTKAEVVKLASTSSLPLSKITRQGGYVWFVTDDPQDVALQSLKDRMTKNGWEFIEQDGSGYFFEKESERVIIESQQWTDDFLLFQLPVGL